MSKVALYRKYRPQTFDGVIGQDIIVKVLTNQISKGSVSHAYLFTGSRGTGKTSCAKIFARAINCVSPINGSPCGKCKVCKELENPTNLDIIEMDAASNNGVDSIRDLREIIGYMPSHGKYRVYIIDEVHMLSSSAFNALLKTLEEPPAHVVFILCTTESHKLPATILSRCMRFDFRLVALNELARLVESIFDKEGITAEEKAVLHIAKLGEGSVRDTLSIADRCLNAGNKLTYDDVLNITGISRIEESAELIESVIRSDVKNLLEKIESMASAGKSISLISRDLMQYARDMIAVLSGAPQLVAAADEAISKMTELCGITDAAFMVKLISALSGADAELRYSVSPKIVLEGTLLSLCVLSTKTSSRTQPAPISEEAPAKKETPFVPIKSEKQTADDEMFDSVNDPEKAVELLGGILKALRSGDERYLPLYGEWRQVQQENIRLIGNIFIVYVDKRRHLVLSNPEYVSRVSNILSAKDGYKFQICLLEEKASTDKLSEIIKAAGGSAVLLDKKNRRINNPDN